MFESPCHRGRVAAAASWRWRDWFTGTRRKSAPRTATRSVVTHRSSRKICRATGGYLLSDDPQRLCLVQAALVQDGRAREFVPLETQSLVVPAYHRFLHRKYPQTLAGTRFGHADQHAQSGRVDPAFWRCLAKTNELYYLHPSFGYYFEQFYLEPHGLVYKMKTLPADTLLPPLPDKKLIAENETFWTQTAAQALASD